MEALIKTLTINRETEELISTTENYEELSPRSFSHNLFDEFCEVMADEFIRFKKSQESEQNEKS